MTLVGGGHRHGEALLARRSASPCHGSKFDLAGRVYRGSPAPEDNLFRQVERAAVEHVGSDLDTLRRTRDAAQEAAFVALYGGGKEAGVERPVPGGFAG